MTHSEPRFIGKRIAVSRSKDQINIKISQKVERWQEALLITWLAAWVFCGFVFIWYIAISAEFSQRMFFIILTAVWLFFLIRISKVLVWRKQGSEIITMTKGKMTLKNAFGRWGKTEIFNYQNIFQLGLIKRDPTSFLAFLDDSFWIIGGDRVGFSYSGTKIRLGKQLSLKDAELLIRVIESGMRDLK